MVRPVGILDWLGLRPPAPRRLEPASPWADNSHLTRVTWAELFPGAGLVLDRRQAMAVPAVAAAHHRIVGTLSRLPLRTVSASGSAWDRAINLVTQPDESEPHVATLRRTLADLLFDGGAWWAVVTAYSDAGGKPFPRSIVHVPTDHVDANGVPTPVFTQWLQDVRGLRLLAHPVLAGRPWLIYFDGPHPGLLNFAQPSIRAASAMEAASGRAAQNPVPSIELHQTGGTELTDEQVATLTSQWAAARSGRNGGVAYTNSVMEVRTHGQADAQLLVDGRNQSAVDIARLAGIPASSIDAGIPGASITYANLTERTHDLVNMGLQPYASAITARLSMNDVLPAGVTVRFDYSELYPATQADTTTPTPAPAGTPTGATP